MSNFFSTSAGGRYNDTSNPPVEVSLDNLRRTFDLSQMVAELRPLETPFFTYLTKVRRMPTTDPVFKMMEQRHQWQRRNFHVNEAVNLTGAKIQSDGIKLSCRYDSRGKETATDQAPGFFVGGQVVAIEGATNTANNKTGTLYGKIDSATVTAGDVFSTVTIDPLFILGADKSAPAAANTIQIPKGSRGQVVGSAYPEGGGKPTGWADVLGQTEGYAQIFKTACPIMSGTAMATEYRGKKNEFQRIWDEKMREHKMDVEHAALFGVGHIDASGGVLTAETANAVKRYTWGILPYVSLHGNVANFSYASSGYNDFVDFNENFFAPENGNSQSKLVLASRKIIGWFNKLNSNSFLGNTMVAEAARLDVQSIKSQFGFNLTRINTVFGEHNFVSHPLLRGQWEDYAIVIDLPNVAYRPLIGNGLSRDTYYQTNVQAPDVDGRVDQIITEAGIQILLPETHAVLKWK